MSDSYSIAGLVWPNAEVVAKSNNEAIVKSSLTELIAVRNVERHPFVEKCRIVG